MNALTELNAATPGPWECNLDDTGIMDSHIGYVSIDDGRKEIARVRLDRSDGRANALVLTEAPELLSQLEYAVKLLGAFPMLNATAQVQSMRETIAKARGAA